MDQEWLSFPSRFQPSLFHHQSYTHSHTIISCICWTCCQECDARLCFLMRALHEKLFKHLWPVVCFWYSPCLESNYGGISLWRSMRLDSESQPFTLTYNHTSLSSCRQHSVGLNETTHFQQGVLDCGLILKDSFYLSVHILLNFGFP